MESKIIETTWLPLNLIKTNEGQIEGLPSNPRILIGDKFDSLCQSIKDNPEMLELRELLVWEQDGEYITIGGNMRLQAMRYLRHVDAPCKIIPSDTTIEQLRRYVIKDNGSVGEWINDELESDWNDVKGMKEYTDWTEAEEIDDDIDVEEESVSLTFTLSGDQFKHVKQKLNQVDKEDNANALFILIEDYEREQEQGA